MKRSLARFTTAVPASAGQKFTPIRRIIALGDVHGDLAKAETILKASGVMHPTTKKWQECSKDDGHGGLPTKLVQCGDLVHRGQQDVDVMDLFLRLRNEATVPSGKTNGHISGEGNVICLLGNHEEMMAWGSTDYAEASRYQYMKLAEGETKFYEAMKKIMGPGEKFGKFIRAMPLVHLDGQTVFNHAGLHPHFLKMGGPNCTSPQDRVADLNSRAVKEWLGERNKPSVLADPVWNREIYEGAKHGSNTKDLDETLKLLDAARMVVGHTPHQSVITPYSGGKLYGIDIAMSSGMHDRAPEALEILIDEHGVSQATHAITADGSRRPLTVTC